MNMLNDLESGKRYNVTFRTDGGLRGITSGSGDQIRKTLGEYYRVTLTRVELIRPNGVIVLHK